MAFHPGGGQESLLALARFASFRVVRGLNCLLVDQFSTRTR